MNNLKILSIILIYCNQIKDIAFLNPLILINLFKKIRIILLKFRKYLKALQGTKDDTVELNINFKTILVNYLR